MYLRTVILCLIVVLATVVPAPQHAQAQEPGQPEFPTVPETPGEQGANLPHPAWDPISLGIIVSGVGGPVPFICTVCLPELVFYHSNSDGDWDIYRLTDDGLNTLANNVTRGVGSHDIQPSYAPEGDWLAFTSDRDELGGWEIYLAKPDGSQQVRLTYNSGHDVNPVGGPANLMAWESNRDGNWEIYMADVTGNGLPIRLTNDPGNDVNPFWLPDGGCYEPAGGRLVFQSDRVRAGESVSVRATVLPTAPLTRDESVSVRLLRGDGTVGSVVQAPDRPTTSWVPGQAVDLGPIPVPVNLFTASGTIELEFGLTRSAFEGLGNAVRREVDVQGREGTVSPTPARVGDLGGAPALFIGGRPAVPMMYLQGRTPVPAEYGQMARAGYRVFSLSIDMGWRGEGVYDYADTDHRIISALEQAQDAYVIPRVEVTAPAWWCDAHPEETVGCADGTHWVEDDFGGTKHQSFASELWRSEAAEALVKLIEHFRESPYADRVVGYHIASGIYGPLTQPTAVVSSYAYPYMRSPRVDLICHYAMGAMGQTPDECIAAADHALYRAKRRGRGTVMVAEADELRLGDRSADD